jgi:hypothetical protein
MNGAYAIDTWSTTTGVLTAPIVQFSDTRYYSNVTGVLNTVVSAGTTTGSVSAGSYDIYNSTTGQLTIPAINIISSTGTKTYYNVVVTIKSITSVGGLCASATSCSQYSTPAQFASLLSYTKVPSLTAATAFTNRGRYMISDSATPGTAASPNTTANYLSIGSTYSASTGYTATSGNVMTSTTLQNYLSMLFQVVASSTDSSGYFRIDSHLHPNNSLDSDATNSYTLKFRNNFGKATTTYGYVVFSYDNTNHVLIAQKRYLYSYDSSTYIATYTEDASFSKAGAGYYVSYSSGAYKLVSSLASATKLYLFTPADNFGVPTRMNPASVSYVSTSTTQNPPNPYITKVTTTQVEGTTGSVYKSINSKYQNQVSTAGGDATTKLNADTYLATIVSTLASKGQKLRYDASVYTAFRDSLLSRKLASDAIADGTPGQNMVPYVWYTNEQDSSGNYHPFMMIVSYGNPASPHLLLDNPKPPGGLAVTGCTFNGQSGGYPCSRVTRYSNLDNYIMAIPLKDYGVVTDITSNSFGHTLYSDCTASSCSNFIKNVYSYASATDNGMMIDGQVMFPVFNNTLTPSQYIGELTANGCHVGQGGGGPHCHADGYAEGSSSPLYTTIYNDTDYSNKTHPPLIGFGYDGIALFGVYRSSDTTMLGYATALDAFGGHNHDGIGYHYHAHVVAAASKIPSDGVGTSGSTTFQYQLNVLMKGGYAGNVSSVPGFAGCTASTLSALCTSSQADAQKYKYGN